MTPRLVRGPARNRLKYLTAVMVAMVSTSAMGMAVQPVRFSGSAPVCCPGWCCPADAAGRGSIRSTAGFNDTLLLLTGLLQLRLGNVVFPKSVTPAG